MFEKMSFLFPRCFGLSKKVPDYIGILANYDVKAEAIRCINKTIFKQNQMKGKIII